jgi:hypothetical protein
MARARKRKSKRTGCVPTIKSDCGKGGCSGKPTYVRSYTVPGGKYKGTFRSQYCRNQKPRAMGRKPISRYTKKRKNRVIDDDATVSMA